MDGRSAKKKYSYTPLIPRLWAMFENKDFSKKMQYRSQYKSTPGEVSDVFDGTLYQELQAKKIIITLNGVELDKNYFADEHDIALGLSTDGFAPWRKQKYTAWPLIVFNYNLPPEI